MKNTMLVCGGLVVAAMLTGCQNNKTADAAKPAAGMLNSKCPISKKDVNPAVTSDYKGGKVAFCCAGCQGDFAKMSDADKAAKVAGVTAAK